MKNIRSKCHQCISVLNIAFFLCSLISMSFVLPPATIYAQTNTEDRLEKAEKSLKKGINLYKSSDFDAAIFELKEAAAVLSLEIDNLQQLTQTKKLIDAHLYLGLAYIGAGDTIRAKEQFSQVVKLDRDFTLSPQKYSNKVILIFNEARAETFATLMSEKDKKLKKSEMSTPQPISGEESEQPKKKWYKKWWVWGLIGGGAVALAAVAASSVEEDENTPPEIASVTLDPQSEVYSYLQVITLQCHATDVDNDELRYTWTCPAGAFENSDQSYTSLSNTVRWSYAAYGFNQSHQALLKREQQRTLSHLKIQPFRNISPSKLTHRSLQSGKALPHASRLLRHDLNLTKQLPRPSLQLPILSQRKAGSRNDRMNESVDIQVLVNDGQGGEDTYTFTITFDFFVPVSKVGFVQAATLRERDVRLKQVLITIDGDLHLGPFDLNDVGYNNNQEIQIEINVTNMRAYVSVYILDVYPPQGSSTESPFYILDVNPLQKSSTESPLLRLSEFRVYSPILENSNYNFGPNLFAIGSYEHAQFPASNANDDDVSTFWLCPNPIDENLALAFSDQTSKNE
ncbi:hypothetical protein ACFL27_06405 [candidate division CSSED10-310 bacterium]|uniref:Tetratricopeptide repeat protein n=1 Tax=candidate division CSSED10-310 bacterium TaxID=2855610 RepID=A0ABV6YUS3_UNCC1